MRACFLLMSSSLAFMVPVYVSVVLENFVIASLAYALVLTSIANHGTYGRDHIWHTIDKSYAHLLYAAFTISALWNCLVKGNKMSWFCVLCAALAGLCYKTSRMNRGVPKGLMAHACLHVFGALGLTVCVISRHFKSCD